MALAGWVLIESDWNLKADPDECKAIADRINRIRLEFKAALMRFFLASPFPY